MSGQRRFFDENSAEIGRQLYDWDVLGMYSTEDRPNDDEEYDDLVVPLLRWREEGASPSQLSTRLVGMLRRDYGLDYSNELAELAFATSLHQWWQSRAEDGDR